MVACFFFICLFYIFYVFYIFLHVDFRKNVRKLLKVSCVTSFYYYNLLWPVHKSSVFLRFRFFVSLTHIFTSKAAVKMNSSEDLSDKITDSKKKVKFSGRKKVSLNKSSFLFHMLLYLLHSASP